MIEIIDLKKSFDEVEVLKGISNKFEKGKVNLIIGQSGSGKTVMMKCLLALHPVSSGKVLFSGEDFNSATLKKQKQIRSEIGTVFQYSALFDSVKVINNVVFPLEIQTKLSKSEMFDRAEEALRRVNMEEHLEKLPSELSGGMQKRVAIARAIVTQPKYLFCDEPNSGLDPKNAAIIDNLIQQITEEYHTTTIMNTHDMHSVLTIGERILFLRNGIKEWEGSKEEIKTSENPSVKEFMKLSLG